MAILRFTLAATTLLVIVSLLCVDSQADAGEKKDGDAKKVELRGTIKTGIAAIGGETTGTVITTKDTTYELAVPKALRAAVDKLNAKAALVTGTLSIRKGIEVKERRIVTVESVKAAD